MGICNGFVCSSGGGASSVLELGNRSSKSSISASIDSLSKAEKGNSDFNYDSAERAVNSSSKIILARVEGFGTSSVPLAAGHPKEPVTGLKLGRTFFEDAKKSRISPQNLQNPKCQVEGCDVDLTTAKDYHRKHRVCECHSKSPKVIVAGRERRFCQQCSRFHGLSEFDQKKRSCRRRLSDHNARRRKPQPATISFSSSRLSSSYYDDRHHMNLVFGGNPLYHVTTDSPLEDDPSSFKLIQPKDSWIKSNKAGDINEQLQFSSTCQTHNISTLHHDLNRLLPFKGTTAEVLNQGLEVPVFASSLGGAPDLRRALSLLSNNSWSSANPGPSSNVKFVNTKNTNAAHPAVDTVDSTAGFLQVEQPIRPQSTMLPLFNLQNHNGQFQEFQLLKSPYQASFFDSTQIH
ncbi:hypothetical protein BHE74_00027519 [Ensete ventricosum]|nr:hypothetical protein GW17_00018199 [Ensete ventricosum]RWW65191.1 hypothetical protein BHE74_00027519 [Ensete ventricosum]RZR85300.1 hypothetical protein BHM03_00012258 [Ensete ventricosum]